ncbi:MAG: peptidase S1 [Anaerolinea sp.]|nr:peptidase S1 [Anaerolinea sp.]
MTTPLLGRFASAHLDAATGDLIARIARSLVAIRTRGGGGSGTIWLADGLIVTNHHVVPGDYAEVVTWDDRSYQGRVVARDAASDLAALRIDASGLEALEAGDSAGLKPGHVVFAIGNPWGIRGSVTAGIVLSRAGAVVENNVPIERAIRADLRLAPGNSGGPLVDAEGRVVGINSMIAGGLAVAVPSATVVRFLEGALDSEPGVLGLHLQPVEVPEATAASFQIPESAALMLTEVEPGSPAEAAGLLPGDLLLGFAGGKRGARAAAEKLGTMRAGKPVRLVLLRAGELREAEATPRSDIKA